MSAVEWYGPVVKVFKVKTDAHDARARSQRQHLDLVLKHNRKQRLYECQNVLQAATQLAKHKHCADIRKHVYSIKKVQLTINIIFHKEVNANYFCCRSHFQLFPQCLGWCARIVRSRNVQ